MNKSDADKTRKALLAKIRRGLKKGHTARAISDATGYTTSRVYQIKKEMLAAGELKA